jgi:cell division protein FtsB
MQAKPRVERINSRAALPSYLKEEVDGFATRSKTQRKSKTEELEVVTPVKVLPSPIPDKGIGWILLVLGVVGSIHVLVMLGIEFNRTIEMRQNITRLSTDVTALESEVSELKAVIQHGDDQNYREQLAREQGYAFPDEMRFITLPNQ